MPWLVLGPQTLPEGLGHRSIKRDQAANVERIFHGYANQVPELRIVDDELWDAVKRRQSSIREGEGVSKARATRFWERRSAKHLLTGLVYWSGCGTI